MSRYSFDASIIVYNYTSHMERSGITVVVPTYNEASGIVATLTDLSEHVSTLRSRYDVQLLVVDDGSSDGTVGLIEDFAQADGSIEVIEHDRNAGLVAAMKTGAEHARYDTLVFLDADLSYRPEIIEPLVIARRVANASAALASPYMIGGVVANVPARAPRGEPRCELDPRALRQRTPPHVYGHGARLRTIDVPRTLHEHA